MPPDEPLVTEAIASAGDGAAFEQLLGDLRPKMHRLCTH